jgi:hypothetical protein
VPAFQEQVESYELYYFAGGRRRDLEWSGWIRAGISVATVGGADVHVYFWPEPRDMPDFDEWDDSSRMISCNLSSADYPRVVDLLRNESPVYVAFVLDGDDETKGTTVFCTGPEDVGEGEMPWVP